MGATVSNLRLLLAAIAVNRAPNSAVPRSPTLNLVATAQLALFEPVNQLMKIKDEVRAGADKDAVKRWDSLGFCCGDFCKERGEVDYDSYSGG
jgi:hypothetical protein